MEFVLAGLFGFVALEQDYAAAFVTGGEVIARLIELYSRDYVGLCDVLDVALVTKASVGGVSQRESLLTLN